MTKEIRKKRESGSQSANTDRRALLLEQEEERQFQDALEDDEVREALKLLHARGKKRLACDQG